MPRKHTKNVLALILWILVALGGVLVYINTFIWLFACALVLDWGPTQQYVALTLTTATSMGVWFLTKKITNILVSLATSRIGCYTVYMVDAHNDDSNKEVTGGELVIQAMGWTALIIAGFWGAVHILLSLMGAL